MKTQDRVGSFIPSTATLNSGYAREKGIPDSYLQFRLVVLQARLNSVAQFSESIAL
jgi:hypothetical protein